MNVFLAGKGVEAESLDTEKFPVTQQMKDFIGSGGTIRSCGTCIKLRGSGPTDICPLGSLKDMHALIKESDRLVTF